MGLFRKSSHVHLMLGAAVGALALGSSAAWAQSKPITVAPQTLASALHDFGSQTGRQIFFKPELAASKASPGVVGATDEQLALAQILQGTGLTFRREANAFIIEGASDPQSGSAAGDGADQGTVQALIVTAQKKEEAIQDVPIAISAFTEKSLEEQKIEGGFDLLKAIPNVTFSKNNFTSYNFSIRGVGTKAISATTDPGVAVSFNNIALIQNRLFEQEYFDVERVEVLRGPQGTLYGRNATAGVINVISAKPNLHEFDGWVKGEVGNYHSKRVSAMVNIPLVEDKLAIRFAGALTDRQGYDFNEITGNAINGRDLWSGRITVGFNPTDNIRSNLIWEHFEEDDDRSRTGKQLCHRDPGPTAVGTASLEAGFEGNDISVLRRAMFSQGCKPGSLYNQGAFDTPNGLAQPFVFALLALQYGGIARIAVGPDGHDVGLLKLEDPYRELQQSGDMRTIASIMDPKYRAEADVLELNFDVELADALTFTSQTAYDKDQVYSFQDFNRFNSEPIFNDSTQFLHYFREGASDYNNVSPGGYFCDPQIGCSNRVVSFDISQAKSEQFSQEFRLQSSFDGRLNFSAGANYTRFRVLADYYVFNNLLTALATLPVFNNSRVTHAVDFGTCGYMGFSTLNETPVASDDPRAACPYIDMSSIRNLAGDGHNYFRSKNPYQLSSAAAFGEIYWQVRDGMKVTAGLRYTDDRKTFTPVPSQVLLAAAINAGGTVNRGYPELPTIRQHWGEWTGRLGVDWKPDLSITDETMLYAFYSRGYKGGGANPPSPGFATHDQALQLALGDPALNPAYVQFLDTRNVFPTLTLSAAEYDRTFRPEFVNAFEVGAKNTLLGGALTVNADAFFYNYKDYQVSQIRDRTAVNENFDAQTWGLEFEAKFSPSRHLQVIANLGYLDTKIADGMKSIDIMNRTQGNPDWMVVKPWMQYPSNCIAPVGVVENWVKSTSALQSWWTMCGKIGGILGAFGNPTPIDPATGAPYDVTNYPDVNGGAGFYDDVGGNELPNAPHWTANLGAQYTVDVLSDWTATVRGDAYWQSQSWARVYNSDPYDKLHGWYNLNLNVWFEKQDADLKIELYAKNLLDKTPITDAFLNSDDTALTTNVFVLDPRLIGLSIKKGF